MQANTKKRGMTMIDVAEYSVNALAFNPLNPNIAALACGDPYVRLFDKRTVFELACYHLINLHFFCSIRLFKSTQFRIS